MNMRCFSLWVIIYWFQFYTKCKKTGKDTVIIYSKVWPYLEPFVNKQVIQCCILLLHIKTWVSRKTVIHTPRQSKWTNKTKVNVSMDINGTKCLSSSFWVDISRFKIHVSKYHRSSYHGKMKHKDINIVINAHKDVRLQSWSDSCTTSCYLLENKN